MPASMKAILKFDLPEEQEEFESAQRGRYVISAVRRYLDNMRRKLKHNIADDDEARIVQRCVDELCEHLESYDVADIIHR